MKICQVFQGWIAPDNVEVPQIGPYNFQKPIADLNANAVTAGLGTMNPIVDLHAQKEITKSDLDQLEKYADRLFASVSP